MQTASTVETKQKAEAMVKYQRKPVTKFIEAELQMKLVSALSALSIPKNAFYDWWGVSEESLRLAVKGFRSLEEPLDVNSADYFADYCFNISGQTDEQLSELLGVARVELYHWWQSSRKLSMMYMVHGLDKIVPRDNIKVSDEIQFVEKTSGLKINTALKRLGINKNELCIWWYERNNALKMAVMGLKTAPLNISDSMGSELSFSEYCKLTAKVMAKVVSETSGIWSKTLYRWWEDKGPSGYRRIVIHIVYGYASFQQSKSS